MKTSYFASIGFLFACGSALILSIAMACNDKLASIRPGLIAWTAGVIGVVAYTVAYICAVEKAEFVLRARSREERAPCPPYHTMDKHGMCVLQDVSVETETGGARLDPGVMEPLSAVMGGRIQPSTMDARGSGNGDARRICCAANSVPYAELNVRCASSERLRCG
jgi:hypothetical protein